MTEKPSLLEGTLRRVVFRNPESSWSVIRLAVPGLPEPVTAVGSLPEVHPGDHIRLQGEWRRDPKYGEQFRVDSFVAVPPGTREGIRRYLGSGRIPGVGKVLISRIVDAFGRDTLEVIEKEPERLLEVEGVGQGRLEQIRGILTEQKAIREVLIFLQSHGIPAAQAARIRKRFGNRTVAVVREDPFRLSVEIPGIGFRTADRIASSLGIPPEDPRRAEAAILHVLARLAEEGHVFTPRDRLVRRTAASLAMDPDPFEDGVGGLARQGRLVLEDLPEGQAVFLPELHAAERGVAGRLAKLLETPMAETERQLDRVFHDFQKQNRIHLAEGQLEAIRRSLLHKVLLITGGPGTGKTTLIQGILWVLEREGKRIRLCAPTGRAARRIRETTGRPAQTIHRLLAFHPRIGDFLRNEENPLEADTVIVDEASMVDIQLAHHLLQALPGSCQLILVGDIDQLPSVGPGNLLRDLIESGFVEIVRLAEVHRQAGESLIVRNAHRVQRGGMLDLTAEGCREDFFFVERRTPEELLETVKNLVGERIPKRFGFHPIDDIQVLSPMHRGLLGVTRLNQELQQLLNPGGTPGIHGAPALRMGDKVMQIRNNYKREVFNGDLGRVEAIHDPGGGITVRFEDRRVRYESGDLNEVTLAYACSVHKSQGSEYPVTVVVLHTQHSPMLQRNLLYTAMTRGRKLVVLVGSRRAVEIAIRNHRIQKRFTLLAERLRNAGRKRSVGQRNDLADSISGNYDPHMDSC